MEGSPRPRSSTPGANTTRASAASIPTPRWRGLSDLAAIAALIPQHGFVHGEAAGSIDAAICDFIANFYDINTPLKRFVVAHDNVVRHCTAIHQAVGG